MSMLDPTIRRTLPLSAALVVATFGLLALGGASLQGDAQAPGPPTVVMPNVKFEVASIRRNKEAEAQRQAIPIYIPVVPGRAQTLPGGLLRGRGMTVRELIRDA